MVSLDISSPMVAVGRVASFIRVVHIDCTSFGQTAHRFIASNDCEVGYLTNLCNRWSSHIITQEISLRMTAGYMRNSTHTVYMLLATTILLLCCIQGFFAIFKRFCYTSSWSYSGVRKWISKGKQPCAWYIMVYYMAYALQGYDMRATVLIRSVELLLWMTLDTILELDALLLIRFTVLLLFVCNDEAQFLSRYSFFT